MAQCFQASLNTTLKLPVGTTRIRLQKRVMTTGPGWAYEEAPESDFPTPIPLPLGVPFLPYSGNTGDWFVASALTPGGYNLLPNGPTADIPNPNIIANLSILQIS